jgi:hypothetical protein
MKRLSLLAALLTTAGLSGQADAAGRLVDVSVYDRSQGRELPVYYHDGKYYVAGKPGNEYQVSLRSQTSEDLLGVLSVDGVNVISGQTASWNQSGYVLNPWNETEVKGWRKSQHDVARFYFTDLPDSYAARTDRPDDVGVIGVAVFRRKPQYEDNYRWHDRDDRWRRRDESRSAPGDSARGHARPNSGEAAKRQNEDAAKRQGPGSAPFNYNQPQAEQELGTGHGQREHSAVRYTEFERASSQPDEVISIYYDSYRNLAARGIVPEHDHYAQPREPQAFPRFFVPDPPRHRW